MALDKLEIKVNGKDYVCLKPFPITLIQIDAKCTKNDGTLDYDRWTDEMLRLISKDIKKEDLVKFNPKNVKLSSGEELIVGDVSYSQYLNDYNKLEDGHKDVVGVVNTYLRYCGITNYELGALSHDDVWEILYAYMGLFDETELNEVLQTISTFR